MQQLGEGAHLGVEPAELAFRLGHGGPHLFQRAAGGLMGGFRIGGGLFREGEALTGGIGLQPFGFKVRGAGIKLQPPLLRLHGHTLGLVRSRRWRMSRMVWSRVVRRALASA